MQVDNHIDREHVYLILSQDEEHEFTLIGYRINTTYKLWFICLRDNYKRFGCRCKTFGKYEEIISNNLEKKLHTIHPFNSIGECLKFIKRIRLVKKLCQ
jgi:hypothetical protein